MVRPAGIRMVLALTALVGLAAPIAAGPFTPVKIVNDQAITQFEYEQRLLFMQLLRQPGDLEKAAMDTLVDDRLRMSAAKQFGVKMSPERLKTGMEEFASRANLTADKFIAIIGEAGVQPETFRDFVEAGLVWREIIRGKYAPTVSISETQIDRALANGRPLVALQVRLSEIVIPAVGAGRDAALQKADHLRLLLRGGQDFAALARQNSSAASAVRGGALDWMLLTQLKPDAAAAVRGLAPGAVSAPVVLDDSVVIYQMQEQKQELTKPAGIVVDYATYLVPDDGTSAAKLRSQVDTCADLYGAAKGTSADRLTRQTVPQGQVPSDIAGALSLLDAGETSTAVTRGGWRVFLMLCRRGPPETELPSRDEVKLQLTNQILGAQADIYLEELRSEAMIRTP
ncbi:MAG: peptidylprolyl isomerase [Cypionkella sp.]|uniref:peptidylprolyl isomerase n=1 Tax=Cypionkella sp. TaxID=2811411 RepID=UPI002608FDCB|nr:peptidylprolyl isomerase [Cypionkella sp.]MDB5661354.1 peptidylprolyl isomerase [Cypionkella sp.]MDB5666501.1 peptidylprolyl isomerase [Cypionkella sp.]